MLESVYVGTEEYSPKSSIKKRVSFDLPDLEPLSQPFGLVSQCQDDYENTAAFGSTKTTTIFTSLQKTLRNDRSSDPNHQTARKTKSKRSFQSLKYERVNLLVSFLTVLGLIMTLPMLEVSKKFVGALDVGRKTNQGLLSSELVLPQSSFSRVSDFMSSASTISSRQHSPPILRPKGLKFTLKSISRAFSAVSVKLTGIFRKILEKYAGLMKIMISNISTFTKDFTVRRDCKPLVSSATE